jgi:hypothetical protein
VITADTYSGPQPAALVEQAITAHRNTAAAGPVGEFVIAWLAARGVAVRQIDTDDLPDLVCEAVADVVAPDELGAPGSITSDLVYRVMRTAYAATVAHLARTESEQHR